jgi:hypothetical protein
MRGGRRRWRRRRLERGQFIPAWGLAAGLGVIAVVAGIIVTVIVVGSQAPPIGLMVSATASRNSGQDIAIVIPWTVHYPSVAYAAALSTYPTLTCTVTQQQLTQTRTFSNSDTAGGSDQTNSGSLTLNVTGSDHSIQGDFNLKCTLDKDGKQLATASSTVTIPPPSDASQSPSDQTANPSDTPIDTPTGAVIDGDYSIQWGQAINGCTPTGGLVPTLTVTSSGSNITISIGGNTLMGTIDSTSNFHVRSQDGTADMLASLLQNNSPASIANGLYKTYTDQTGTCGYDFTATHK